MYVPSRMTSAKDQPGQLTLKFRQEGQASAADILKRDLRVSPPPPLSPTRSSLPPRQGPFSLLRRERRALTLHRALSRRFEAVSLYACMSDVSSHQPSDHNMLRLGSVRHLH